MLAIIISIVYTIGLLIGCFLVGKYEHIWTAETQLNVLFVIFLWPFCIMFFIILSPLGLFYWIGTKFRQRR
jgi:ABC-type Na+ efflux pump permease subunit